MTTSREAESGTEPAVDVLVIGAGAGGMVAAIAAAEAGASVAILEKMPRAGGNSALSSGSVPGAGTRFQRAAGINDDAACFQADFARIAGETDSPTVTRQLAEKSASNVEWLVDVAAVRLVLITEYKHVGHSVARLHAPRSRRGQDLVDDLLRAVGARTIPLAVNNAVTGLVATVAGAVVGADVQAGNETYRLLARKTILAVNGFAANKSLLTRFCPDIASTEYSGAPGSTGEAISWGEKLHARLANMAAYQGYAAVAYPHGGLLSWTTIEKGGIILNATGRRFGDESRGYSGFTPSVSAQAGYCFAVFDRRILEITLLEPEFAELRDHGGIKEAADIGQLAAAFGLDPGQVAASIEAYNRAASGALRDEFDRRDFGLAPLVPPFCGCCVVPGIFHTQGGLDVDDFGRVQSNGGGVIPNLFAVGGAATGLSGRAGPAGYLSGNGLLSAVGLGRTAGASAAAEAALEQRR